LRNKQLFGAWSLKIWKMPGKFRISAEHFTAAILSKDTIENKKNIFIVFKNLVCTFRG